MRRRDLGRLAAGLVGATALRPEAESASAPPCLLVSDPLFLEHRAEGHPERPERLPAILQALEPLTGLRRVGPRAATDAELTLVHTPAHVARIRDRAAAGGGAIDADTYLGPRSFDVARTAVGALLVGCVDTLGRTLLLQLFREFLPPQWASAAGPAVASVAIYVFMAAVLAIKPQGLFPARG